jgi:hypothetical protein
MVNEDGSYERSRCGDCGCLEGELHEWGCDQERCPICGHQLIICDCVYERLQIDASPGTVVYSEELTRDQDEEWYRYLTFVGRVPYIQWPNMCAYCGKLWPDMFRVPDDDWCRYIQKDMRNRMVCEECWGFIKRLGGGQVFQREILEEKK